MEVVCLDLKLKDDMVVTEEVLWQRKLEEVKGMEEYMVIKECPTLKEAME